MLDSFQNLKVFRFSISIFALFFVLCSLCPVLIFSSLSFVICPLSSVFYPLSSILCSLFSIFFSPFFDLCSLFSDLSCLISAYVLCSLSCIICHSFSSVAWPQSCALSLQFSVPVLRSSLSSVLNSLFSVLYFLFSVICRLSPFVFCALYSSFDSVLILCTLSFVACDWFSSVHSLQSTLLAISYRRSSVLSSALDFFIRQWVLLSLLGA